MKRYILFLSFTVLLFLYSFNSNYVKLHTRKYQSSPISKIIVVHCALDKRGKQPDINTVWWMSQVPHVQSAQVVDLADAPPMHSVDWASTLVVLLLSPRNKKCQQHPWYIESVRRRKRARVVKSTFPESWQGSLFVHSDTVLKRLHKRPLLLRLSGEVFRGSRRKYCSPDIVVYKSKVFPIQCTATLHHLEHMLHMHKGLISKHALYDLAKSRHVKGRIPDRFCTILSKTVSSSLYGNIDHLMRWLLAKQLSEYKQVVSASRFLQRDDLDYFLPQHQIIYDNTTCKRYEWESVIQCFEGFKFVISMENSAQSGYVSEKVILAAMAGAIPIYFGAPDIAKYINVDRIVHCDLDSNARQFLHRTTKDETYTRWNKQDVRDTRIPKLEKLAHETLQNALRA